MGADYEKAHRSMMLGTSDATIAVNQTMVMSPYGGTPHAPGTRARCYVSTPCILSHLRAHSSNAPGAGETFDYTLLFNNVPSALTCQTVNPATESQDLVNMVVLVPGDYIEMEIVTSLNAVASYHTWGFDVRS